MPTGVAWQIQFWADKFCPGAEIALVPIALTRQQVQDYRLPTIPVKDSDLRKANFAARYGGMARWSLTLSKPCTLALSPASWRQQSRLTATSTFAKACIARSATRRTHRDNGAPKPTRNERADLTDLQSRAREIIREYDAELAELAGQMAAELDPIKAELADVQLAITAKIDNFEPDLPDRPEANPRGDVVNPDAWLYASWRDYLEQNDIYRARKNGSMAE